MSASVMKVDSELSSPLSEGQLICVDHSTSNSFTASRDSFERGGNNDPIEEGHDSCAGMRSDPETPKIQPMAFTIDFGSGKSVDKQRLEHLAKQSQARHQRVQSMSASLTRPSPVSAVPQKPPMSVKLPRKTQGYNSEGYFSSDQEDSILSGSVKLKQSPLAQGTDLNKTHSLATPTKLETKMRHIKSPTNDRVADSFQPIKTRVSKSPIVDSIMSRSDTMPSRQSLNLPLRQNNCNMYMKDVQKTSSYANLSSCYQPRHTMADIIDQSPDGLMLTDISSPELDMLTPDNALCSPEHKTSRSPSVNRTKSKRVSPENQIIPQPLFRRCSPHTEILHIDDDLEVQSNNSSTGTYTIEGDNYTEEQKARMSIDRAFAANMYDNTSKVSLRSLKSSERDPELVIDLSDSIIPDLRPPVDLNKTFEKPSKVSTDKNVLEITCCYESPTEDLAAQTSRQIKSTRNYLEKIKNRVRTISEKTFQKAPLKPVENHDVGSFTSVTTSGVLSYKQTSGTEEPARRRFSLTKSQIDQTDYIHRLSRESSVPVSLPSSKNPLAETTFESSALRNAQKTFKDDSGVSSEVTPELVVGKLSYLSLNRCKGDKTWIQEWAESVKKYNSDTLGRKEPADLNSTYNLGEGDNEHRPPLSPRHVMAPVKCSTPRHSHSAVSTPTKIPSPLHTTISRGPQDSHPTDTESYLVRTQNAITNLQAKLHSARSSPLSNNPCQLTSSLISEKTAISRLPVSQLSRSNSLNYRLHRKEGSGGSSPLRSPGNYVITGSTNIPTSTRILLNSATRSLETDKRKYDSNMNSPSSDKGLLSNSSEDKTLSNKPYDVTSILSQHRKAHSRHKSFDGRNPNEFFGSTDLENANKTVSLKTVLKNNALEAQNAIYLSPRIEQTHHGDAKRTNHHRGYSDGVTNKPKPIYSPTSNLQFGNSIKRSSSFNTVNRNNNYIDQPRAINSRRSSGHSEIANEYPKEMDYLSDESDTGSYDKSKDLRYPMNRSRIESPDLKSIAPSNSPRCPNTPEMHRKFGPGLVRNSVRVTSKERALNARMSEPPASRGEVKGGQGRKISDTTRQAIVNRLTKSRTTARDAQPKGQEKGAKKPNQHRSSTSLASKEVEFSNWKKRASYDPMKAAQEERMRKRQQQAAGGRRAECNKDELSSPSHSSPVHRSQSFHSTNMGGLESPEYSSEEEGVLSALPLDRMVTSTHSDILELNTRRGRGRGTCNDVVLNRDYVAQFQVNPPSEKAKSRRDLDKRKTFIIEDVTPTKENVDFLEKRANDTYTDKRIRDNNLTNERRRNVEDVGIDKRKTFILDSDTNSTTNGSSPRNSSIFSHEKNSLTTGTSDTEGESGTESAPVVMRHSTGKRGTPAQGNKRHSGDYSMSSSTTSISREQRRPKDIQPRYLDISKYKSENSSKNFLRRDPSKTYVGVLNHGERASSVSKGSAQQHEKEQKKQELEKWKRRASYDPRKAAALGKTVKTPPKTASSVLRSQSFHGPVLVSTSLRYVQPKQIAESYDASSDNDF